MTMVPPHLPPRPGSMPEPAAEPLRPPEVFGLTRTASRKLAAKTLAMLAFAVVAGMTGVAALRASLGLACVGAPMAFAWSGVFLVVAMRTWASRSCRVFLQDHGLAVEEQGRLRGPLFWRDLTNVLITPDGVLQVSSREEQVLVPCAQLEHGTMVRERIETEYANLWGSKTATFTDLGYFYGDAACRGLEEQRRRLAVFSALLLATMVALIGVAAIAGWGQGRWAYAAMLVICAVPAALSAAGSVRLGILLRESGRIMAETGGVQLGEHELKIITRAREERVVAFADVATVEAVPGHSICLRLRSGESLRLLRPLSYFEPFRRWLIEAAREHGIPVTESAAVRRPAR